MRALRLAPPSLSSAAAVAAVAIAALVALPAVTGCSTKPKQVGDVESPNSSSKNEESPKWEGASRPEEAKPKAAGGGMGTRDVHEAETRRTDVYDKEATEVVIKRAARQVKENCGAAKGEDGKASGPWGKATLQLQLGANGHSKSVTVPSPYQGKPTGNCVEKAFTNLTFPPWGGSDTTIDWEVELVNSAEAKK